MDSNVVLYLSIGLVVILALVFGTRVRFKVNKEGLTLESSEHDEKTNTVIRNVKKGSKVNMKRSKGHDTSISDIEESEINIDQ